MNRVRLIFLTVLAAAGLAPADEVWVGLLPYRGVQVTGVRDGSIVFILNGREVAKPLEDVTRVRLDHHAGLTQAEDLLAAGKTDEAVEAYKAARAAAPGWVAELIDSRQAAARKARKTGPAASGPAEVAPPAEGPGPATAPAVPAPGGSCIRCRGTGRVACTDCREAGVSTGMGVCGHCAGKRNVLCPKCQGQWRKDMCPDCGGRGFIIVERRGSGIVWRDRRNCSRCGGKGWMFVCPLCGKRDEALRGSVPCPLCEGTGRFGPCATCAGSGQAPCGECDAGKAQAGRTPTTLPTAELPLTLPGDLLKDFPLPAKVLPEMTVVDVERAEAEHAARLGRWADAFNGREVLWALKVLKVSVGGETGRAGVQAVARDGSDVRVLLTEPQPPAGLAVGRQMLVRGTLAPGVLPDPPVAEKVRFALDARHVEVSPNPSEFFARDIAGKHVVFLLDRSLSMAPSFPAAREMLASAIDRLAKDQSFHVICFSFSRPLEKAPGRLAYADGQLKSQGRAYVDRLPDPGGRTEIAPALRQAFAALSRPPDDQGHKSLYLLTDGEFPLPGELPDLLKALNADGQVRVHVVMFNHLRTEPMAVMRRVAETSGGRFMFVERFPP